MGTDRRMNGGRRGGEMKGRGCLLVTMMVMEHGSSHFYGEKNFILIKKHFFQIKTTIISLKKQSNSRQQPAFKGV